MISSQATKLQGFIVHINKKSRKLTLSKDKRSDFLLAQLCSINEESLIVKVYGPTIL